MNDESNDRNATFAVITTIHPPGKCVRELQSRVMELDGTLVVVGDQKGPGGYALDDVDFYPLQRQQQMPFALARSLPRNHYTRKNLGYLAAVAAGATCIYETDDDTMPSENWQHRTTIAKAVTTNANNWHNAFRNFFEGKIWPRGFPLDEINNPASCGARSEAAAPRYAPIQQGMIDLSPDVDAIWRLVNGQDVWFDNGPSVYLPPGTWCPFNSQNTWWWPEAFALMYLPSHCEFRATDIWRGLIAQRCLWAMGCGLVFHGPDTIQHRNAHNLMTDFQDEVRGYLNNKQIAGWLSEAELEPGPDAVRQNLFHCYQKLVEHDIFPEIELQLVADWISDLEACQDNTVSEKIASEPIHRAA